MNLYRAMRGTKSCANFWHSRMVLAVSLGRPLPRELRETFCCAKHWHGIWSYALHDTGACRGAQEGALRETFCCAKQWRNIWKLSFRYVLDPGFNFCLNDLFMVFNMNLYRVLRKTKSYANFGHSWMIVEVSLGRPLPRKLRETCCCAKSWRNIWLYALHDTGACRGNFEKHSVVLEIGGSIWKLRFLCVLDPRIQFLP